MTSATEPMIVRSDEIARAAASARPLSARAGDGDLRVDIPANGRPAESFVLPADAVRMVADVLAQLDAGRIVTLIPEHAELTVHQAADLLGVSPAFVVKLVDQGELAARTEGAFHVVRYDELMAYKRRQVAARHEVLDELVREAEDLGLYK